MSIQTLKDRLLTRAVASTTAILKAVEERRYGDAHDSLIRRDTWLEAADMAQQQMEKESGGPDGSSGGTRP